MEHVQTFGLFFSFVAYTPRKNGPPLAICLCTRAMAVTAAFILLLIVLTQTWRIRHVETEVIAYCCVDGGFTHQTARRFA
jgi:hypothetical protein